jgi:hypothetical protein
LLWIEALKMPLEGLFDSVVRGVWTLRFERVILMVIRDVSSQTGD